MRRRPKDFRIPVQVWNETTGEVHRLYQCFRNNGLLCTFPGCRRSVCPTFPRRALALFKDVPVTWSLIAEQHIRIHIQIVDGGVLPRCSEHQKQARECGPCRRHLETIQQLGKALSALPARCRSCKVPFGSGLSERWGEDPSLCNNCAERPEARKKRPKNLHVLESAAQAIRIYTVAEDAARTSAARRGAVVPKRRGGPPEGWRVGRSVLRSLGLDPTVLPDERRVENTRQERWEAWLARQSRASGKASRARERYHKVLQPERRELWAAPFASDGSDTARSRIARADGELTKTKRSAEPFRVVAERLTDAYRQVRDAGPGHPRSPQRFWTHLIECLLPAYDDPSVVALVLSSLAPSRFPNPKDHSLRARISAARRGQG